jgi:hypothetical protein
MTEYCSTYKNRFQCGEKHPRWKGGITTHNGYNIRKCPLHPRADKDGYVMESVLIAEKTMGKYLPPQAVVHHADSKTNNDANSNLVVCENTEYHFLLHRRLIALRESGNANNRKCVYCKKYDSVENLVRYKRKETDIHKWSNYMHRLCLNNYVSLSKAKRKENARQVAVV